MEIKDFYKVAQLKGYKIFDNDSKPFNINYWGIRDKDTGFNDEFYLFWKYNGLWSQFSRMGTTDPGQHYLKNPINDKGTLILQEDQWRGCWELGFHKGQYEALVQCKPVTVWRDYNKDSNLDYTNPDTGFFGCNHHRAHDTHEVSKIGKYSAGCQVTHNPNNYRIFINILKQSAEVWGNSFSYTLINKEDL